MHFIKSLLTLALITLISCSNDPSYVDLKQSKTAPAKQTETADATAKKARSDDGLFPDPGKMTTPSPAASTIPASGILNPSVSPNQSANPSSVPSPAPSTIPSPNPSTIPSPVPTAIPVPPTSPVPTSAPSPSPVSTPTPAPTAIPNPPAPTPVPTAIPTITPAPTATPPVPTPTSIPIPPDCNTGITTAVLKTTFVDQTKPVRTIDYEISLLDCKGRPMLFTTNYLLFDLDALHRETKNVFGTVKFKVVNPIDNETIIGDMTQIVGSDLFGRVGPQWQHYSTDQVINFATPTMTIHLTIDISDLWIVAPVIASSYTPDGNMLIATYLRFGTLSPVQGNVKMSFGSY